MILPRPKRRTARVLLRVRLKKGGPNYTYRTLLNNGVQVLGTTINRKGTLTLVLVEPYDANR